MSVEDTTETTEESTAVDSSATTEEPTGEVQNPTDGTQESPAGEPDGSTEEVKESTSEESEKTSAESEEASEHFFNGEQVQIEVPDDLKNTLSESGVDVDKVVSELYGKDSDFTLSDETRAPLDEKYGKPVVDTFLNALKTQNESVLKGAQEATKAAEEANKQAEEWSNELVGGEENWSALESWAADNLEEAQIESFNRAMASGDKWMQELAIKDLHSKMQESEGDTNVSLVSGDAPGGDSAGSPLSAQDYIAEMTSPEFRNLKGQDKVKAQQQLDARRRVGMKRGL